ncbi:MAG TPA: CHAP domain-containing protein [Cystobacter sp.]|jgi:hypothetical protein
MFQFPTRLLSRSLVTVSIALAGCGGTEMDDAAQVSDAEHEDIAQVESAACGYCDNCVLHARCLAPGLPFGLTYWTDKVAVINSSTARAGCVAMIPSSNSYGHAAYVSSVSGTTIRLNEANWQAGVCSSRSGTKAGLNIRGFWCP